MPAEDELGLPELIILFATDLAVLDHPEGSILLIANAVNCDNHQRVVDVARRRRRPRLDG